MDDHESSCAFLVHDTTRLIRRRFQWAIRDLGITEARWRVLVVVERRPGISQSALAELLDIEKAPLGLALEGLAQDKLIRRETDASDRRVRRVFIADEATPTLALMAERFRAIESNYLRGFDAEEIEQMMECLRMIRAELRTGTSSARREPPPQPDNETYLTLLFECARLLARRFDSRLAELGHTRAQWLVLNTVSRREGLRQTEIADITEIAVAPLGRILDVLEKGGWIERRPDAKDRRANRLHISRRAAHMLAGMRARFESLHESLVLPLGEERRKLLVDRLGWIRHRLLEESAHAVETRRAGARQ